MPEVKFVQVVDVSSQDEKYPAKNIINKSGKWLCNAVCKERCMEATFVLDEPCVITSIDIGNCGSAYISILVSDCTGVFKELLPKTSLLTVSESRFSTKKGQVKFFNIQDHFMVDTKEKKWSQMKIACEQPFNIYQFGLNFVRAVSIPNALSKSPAVSVKTPFIIPVRTETSNNNVGGWEEFKKKYRSPKITSIRRQTLKNGLSPVSNLKPCSLLDYYSKEDVSEKEETMVGTAKLCNKQQGSENDQEMFEAFVLSFLDSLNLKLCDLDTIKAKDIREKFEEIHGDTLTLGLQDKFYHILSKHVKEIKQIAGREISKSTNDSSNDRLSSDNNEINDNSQASCSNLKQTCKGKIIDDPLVEAVKLNNSLNMSPSVRRNQLSLVDTGPKENNSNNCSQTSPLVSKAICSSSSSSMKRNSNLIIEDVSPSKMIILEDNHDEAMPVSDDLVECPLCKVFLEHSEAEAHLVQCTRPKEENVICPICKKLVAAVSIPIHADACAQSVFGD